MKKWRVLVTYKVPGSVGGWAVLEPCYQYFDAIEARTNGEAWKAADNLVSMADPDLIPWSRRTYAERHDRPEDVRHELLACIAKGWRHVTVP